LKSSRIPKIKPEDKANYIKAKKKLGILKELKLPDSPKGIHD
jgi:hypothetical protein